MAKFSKPRAKPHYTGTNRKTPIIECDVIDCDLEQETQNSAESMTKETQSTQKAKERKASAIAWFHSLILVIVGSFITLSFWIGMQWAGFLSPFLRSEHIREEQALQIAEIAKSQAEETTRQLHHIIQELDALKTAFSIFSSQGDKSFQRGEVSQEENKEIFAALEKKVNVLEENIQNLVAISHAIHEALLAGQGNTNDFAALKQQIDTLREEITAKSDAKGGIDPEFLMAINALKNAVDQGKPYANELEIIQRFSPSVSGLDLLQETANTGLPSSAKLAADFSSIADTIVGQQNIVAPDAGFFAHIWAWIKSLFVLRPVGNVEGVTVGAIVARMEMAIQVGDYEKALAEWQTLPQSAQDISVDFMQQLKRHLTVQRVFQQLLIFVQQGSSKAIKM
ncbi:COG4223 family protein [Bartonella schoenbuchensis]|uniref:Membrane protein n=1 Tax=Bartonella schoenbuchensis m07a TaxID=1094496 RepID=N6UDT0_9HYPH|nr:mitofilin family membrane protein [Bartonella schoenbuchensis]ENN90719.1 putative membrane protein [Bartonella schoenbuchensis m07a]